MIEFVNAKINIGLNIVGKREDGYHLLETVFYPVGVRSGTPLNPSPFCDIMEMTPTSASDPAGYEECGVRFLFGGRPVECPPEKNLVVKGIRKLEEHVGVEAMRRLGPHTLRLMKYLPEGAGMGGGSADAVAAMRLLRDALEAARILKVSDDELCGLALEVGADCPFFVAGQPAYGEGIGERLTPLDAMLKGMWLVVVKPMLSISTAEAFAGVKPKKSDEPLVELVKLPLPEWKGRIHNDFEDSLFPKYPELKRLKEKLYEQGAEYASMTGSGAALYGIFTDAGKAEEARRSINADYTALLLL